MQDAQMMERPENDNAMALDVEGIGRIVRRLTLEAVATHFAAVASDTAAASATDRIHEAAQHAD